jgi:Arc/MetJ-type ribon-helix-helix transcriptional regulator
MSNQLAGEEQMKSPSVRVRADLLDDFDDAVEENERWNSRSEAIRDFMASVVEDGAEDHDGRAPPVDDELADAYEVLCTIAPETYVTEDRVLSVLAQQQGMKKPVARQTLVLPLVDLGYAKRTSNVTGDTAVKALR